MKKQFITAGLLSALAISAQAQDDLRLDDTAIRTLVVGKTLLGSYPDGTPWRETFFIDDGTDYQDPQFRLRGTWYAQNGALCTFYDDTIEFEGGCFAVIKRSDNCIEFYALDRDTMQPKASPNNMRLGIDWTARGWRSDQQSSCEDAAVS